MADELKTFLRQHLDIGKRTDELEALLGDLDYELAVLYHELLEYNADFDALRMTEDHGDAFTSDEIDELRSLLGCTARSAIKDSLRDQIPRTMSVSDSLLGVKTEKYRPMEVLVSVSPRELIRDTD